MTLFVSDLDGTLLRFDTSLSDYTIRTVNGLADDFLFTYATARSFASASPLVKKLKLRCPAVIFNGVFVVDPISGKRLAENVYSKECRSLAQDFFIEHNIAPLVYSHIDGQERVSYLESRSDDVKYYLSLRKNDKRLRPVDNYGELFKGEIFYFTVIDPKDTAPLNALFTKENGFSRNVQRDTYDDMIWYEIFDKNASKSNAVLQIKSMVNADKLVCFGDNLNDISMIKAADAGVAVENACEELKSLCDEVTFSNNEDGVARYIDRQQKI